MPRRPLRQRTPLPPVAGGERLQAIMDRGQVICGVHGTFQGFGFVDSAGTWTGFDVDFCRAWAAALFNDPNAVEFRGSERTGTLHGSAVR